MDKCSACEAGVFLMLLADMTKDGVALVSGDRRQLGSYVDSLIIALITLSYHVTPRIRHSDGM